MLPALVLLVLSVLFRLPALLNAASVDSDSAIVGLQAMHLLHGEWSPFLFGSGYQTSVDSCVAAVFFLFLGPAPIALMLSTFLGHLALTGLAYATLQRHLRPWTAAIVVLPLVFTPAPLHTYILGPPRQASLTLVFLAVWLLDGASRAKHPRLAYGGGAAVAAFACYADPYALLFLPALLLLALLASADGEGDAPRRGPEVFRRLGACAIGGAAGIVPLVLLWRAPGATHGETTLGLSFLAHNAKLLREEALPWILSATAYFSRRGIAYGPWHAPAAFRAVQWVGALSFLGAMAFGAIGFARGRAPWRVRRLGLVGFVMLPLTLGAFLLSSMVMDLFSTRYLAAIVLASPLAFAPLGWELDARRLGALLAPYLVSAAVAGWLGFGSFVEGPLPLRTARGQGTDEGLLSKALAQRGVSHAMADYWVAYRMTFLAREKLEVVPLQPALDRYAPYRTGLARDAAVAYVFDSARSSESFQDEQRELTGPGGGFEVDDRIDVGDLTALVLRRARKIEASAMARTRSM